MNSLPNTYQQVEYIESTGTQYIDTGITYNTSNSYKVDADLKALEGAQGNYFFGWNAGGACGAKDNYYMNIGAGSIAVDTSIRTQIAMKINAGTNTTTDYQGVQPNNTQTGSRTHENLSSYAKNLGFPIFGMASQSDVGNNTYMQLYSISIKVNDILVRNLIPCYRKTDNEIGLYDLVNDVFYTNQGTGSFIKRNNVTIADKLSYLIETVDQIDEKSIDLFGEDFIEDATFRELAEAYAGMYDKMDKVTASGDKVSLTPAAGKLEVMPKGNTLQNSYSGKNLLKLTPTENNGITFTVEGETLIANGTATNIARCYMLGTGTENVSQMYLLKAGTYYLTAKETSIPIYVSKVNGAGLTNLNAGQTKKTFTINEDTYVAVFASFAQGNVADNLTASEVMLSQDDSSYEPYVGGNPAPNPSYPQEIKNVTGDNNVVIRGKNLFDIDKVNEPSTGVTVVKTNTSVKGTFLTAYTSAGSIFLNLKNKVYSFKGEITNTGNGARFEIRYYKNETQVGNTETTYDFKSIDNTSNIYDTVKITLSNGTDIGEITFKEMQLVEGTYTSSTMPNYGPYITPIEKELNLGNIELCKIGDYQDIIFKNEPSNENYDNTLVENAWYKKGVIGKVVFDGSEDERWTKDGNQDNSTDYFYIQDTGITSDNINTVFCDKFVKGNMATQGFWATLVFCITINKTYTGIVSKDDKNMRIQKFKTWLSNNNTILYYQLATPTYTQITETPLINQLESLNRTIIPAQTIVIETKSNEENAKLNIAATAIRKEDGE